MIFLPLRFLKFWFIDSLNLFFRTWVHLISLLEEDLSVGLMWRLLLTPLFHDKSFTGYLLSFVFRLSRVFFGIITYIIASVLILFLSVSWLFIPVFLFLNPSDLGLKYFVRLGSFEIEIYTFSIRLFFFFGVGLFFENVLLNPRKKVWNIKTYKDIYQATRLKKSQVTWDNLLKTWEVQNFLADLELQDKSFTSINLIADEETLKRTLDLGIQVRAKYITPVHFFVALLYSIPNIENELLRFGLNLTDFFNALKFYEMKRNTWRKVYLWDDEFLTTHLKGVNRGWLGFPTPNLDTVSIDLTKESSRFGFDSFIGRASVVSEVINVLSQAQDRNVCLVGPPGVGRSALVKHLANMIIAGDAPDALSMKRIVQIDLGKLIAGLSAQGEIASRLNLVFEEIKSVENLIIFFDEIQNFGLGDVGEKFNLLSLILPFIEDGSIQCIIATEGENYSKIVERNISFARVFRKIEILPATNEETLEILETSAIQVQKSTNLKFSFLSLKTMVDLSHTYIHDRVLPDSAISVFHECQRLVSETQINATFVKEVIEKRVHMSLVELDEGAKTKLLTIEKEIHKKFADQEEAVTAVANTLRRGATGLRDKHKPIGSFLFVGPTGVGKTELAKVLSEVYFQSKDSFLRFDMSEFQTPDSLSRLIGDTQNPGLLTEAVRNKQYCLILLDEFEKADLKLITIFLQILDDGRLTDGSGRLVNFQDTIIIATSNAASLIIAESIKRGLSANNLKLPVAQELLKIFKPELINRFDEVVIFKPLTSEDLRQIVIKRIESLQNELKEKGYLVGFSEDLVERLTQMGFDPVFGARPLRRLIQDTLEANLSKMILENKLIKGQPFTADSALLVRQTSSQ